MIHGAQIRLVLARANRAVEQADRASIAKTGLNVSDFMILEILLHKGPMPINAIGGKVLLTSGSMTAAANRLEAKGLITRIKNPADGRCFYLHLTKSGRTLIQEAYATHRENLEAMAAPLDQDERAELVRLLRKLGRRAEEIEPA